MRRFVSIFFLTPLLLSSMAQAVNEVFLVPNPATRLLDRSECVRPGIDDCLGAYFPDESIPVDLSINFDDPTVGGAVNIGFDDRVATLESFVFSPEFTADDPTFRCPNPNPQPGDVPCPDDPTFVSFGSFNGISGENLVGTAVFRTLIDTLFGESFVDVSQNRAFSDLTGSPLEVSFNREGLVTTPIPEPSTALLLAAGIIALGAGRRATA